MSRDEAAILDIQDAVKRAIEFTRNVSEEQFIVDNVIRWAVYSQIVLIGEAANRLSAEYRAAHQELPWKQMIGMRHRLVHGYDDINWERVWKTTTDDLPGLLTVLSPLVPRSGP